MVGVMLNGDQRKRWNKDLPNLWVDGLRDELARGLRVEATAFKSFASAFAVFFRFALTEETLEGFNHVFRCGHEAPRLLERLTLIIANTEPTTVEL